MRSVDLRSVADGPRRTAHEYVRATLRAAILGGALQGGSRLVQADVARELGVSTTPVREALRDLATEGLVTLDAHRGGIVKRLSFAELYEIHELCQILEPEAMRRAVERIGDDELGAARELAERMEQETDPTRWTELNREFHAILTNAAGSQRLVTILRGLRDSAAPYVALAQRARDPEQVQTANRQHAEIIEAFLARDGDRCASLMHDHVELTVRDLVASRDLFDDSSAS